MTEPLISVVIPCCGGIDDTRECLSALRTQHDATRYEVILVDNASGDGTRELDREFAEVRVVAHDENRGFAAGVNAGVAAARGDRILVLNNDTMPAPRMLASLEAALDSDPNIAAVAPTSNHVKGEARVDVGESGLTAAGRSEIEALLIEACRHAPLQDVETLSGLCLLVRRSTLAQSGGFDERFGSGMFEDDDLCLRWRLAGHRLVIARAAFLHHRGHRTFRRLGHDVRQTLLDRAEIFRSKWASDPAGSTHLARMSGDLATAAAHVERAIVWHPAWPDAHLVRAEIAFARGDTAVAGAAIERFLVACPRHGRARWLAGLVQIAAGESKRGLAEIRRALDTCWFGDKDLASALGKLGKLLVERGDHAAAAVHLTDAAALDPAAMETWATLGVAYIGLQRYEDAARALERADPADAATRNNLGICAWHRGESDLAIAEFERASSLAPSTESYRENLARARSAVPAPQRG